MRKETLPQVLEATLQGKDSQADSEEAQYVQSHR
jgi:hypothetical protein